MMKYIHIAILLLAINFVVRAQVGLNTADPDTSAMIDLKSDSLGLLIPRMSSSDRNSISSPANGLLIYDTDEAMLLYFDTVYSTSNTGWTGLSPWIFRDGDGNLYLKQGARSLSVGSANPNTSNMLTVVGNMSVGDTLNAAPTEGLQVKGQTVFDDNVDVQGVASASVVEGYGTVPIGGIIMWSGSLNDMPVEFALCDGNSGAPINGVSIPDLRGRFLVGYNSSTSTTPTNATNKETNYARMGNTGGETVHTLTINEMPSHDHGGSTSTDGAHNHSYTEQYLDRNERVGGVRSGSKALNDLNSFTSTTESAGNHSHTIANDGGGQSHENRPPYYVMAFIIRTR